MLLRLGLDVELILAAVEEFRLVHHLCLIICLHLHRSNEFNHEFLAKIHISHVVQPSLKMHGVLGRS